MDIDIAFLGPVVHAPGTGRRVEAAYEPMRARVGIRELSRSEVGEGPVLSGGGAFLGDPRVRICTWLVDGEPWVRLGGLSSEGRGAPWPGPDDDGILGWLRGDPPSGDEERGAFGVTAAFACTPLAPRPLDRKTPLRPRQALAALPRGRILLDLREGAEAAVRELAAGDLALVDGVLLRRMRGPLAFCDRHNWRIATCPGLERRDAAEGNGLYYRIDRIPKPGDLPHVGDGTKGYAFGAAHHAIGTLRGDDDVAATLTLALRGLAARVSGREALEPGIRQEVHQAAVAASAGIGTACRLPEIRALAERGILGIGSTSGGLVLAYLREYADPILADHAPDADIDALSILSPSM